MLQADDYMRRIQNAAPFSVRDKIHLHELLLNESLQRALREILAESDAKVTLLGGIDLYTADGVAKAQAVQAEARALARAVEIIVDLTQGETND